MDGAVRPSNGETGRSDGANRELDGIPEGSPLATEAAPLSAVSPADDEARAVVGMLTQSGTGMASEAVERLNKFLAACKGVSTLDSTLLPLYLRLVYRASRLVVESNSKEVDERSALHAVAGAFKIALEHAREWSEGAAETLSDVVLFALHAAQLLLRSKEALPALHDDLDADDANAASLVRQLMADAAEHAVTKASAAGPSYLSRFRSIVSGKEVAAPPSLESDLRALWVETHNGPELLLSLAAKLLNKGHVQCAHGAVSLAITTTDSQIARHALHASTVHIFSYISSYNAADLTPAHLILGVDACEFLSDASAAKVLLFAVLMRKVLADGAIQPGFSHVLSIASPASSLGARLLADVKLWPGAPSLDTIEQSRGWLFRALGNQDAVVVLLRQLHMITLSRSFIDDVTVKAAPVDEWSFLTMDDDTITGSMFAPPEKALGADAALDTESGEKDFASLCDVIGDSIVAIVTFMPSSEHDDAATNEFVKLLTEAGNQDAEHKAGQEAGFSKSGPASAMRKVFVCLAASRASMIATLVGLDASSAASRQATPEVTFMLAVSAALSESSDLALSFVSYYISRLEHACRSPLTREGLSWLGWEPTIAAVSLWQTLSAEQRDAALGRAVALLKSTGEDTCSVALISLLQFIEVLAVVNDDEAASHFVATHFEHLFGLTLRPVDAPNFLDIFATTTHISCVLANGSTVSFPLFSFRLSRHSKLEPSTVQGDVWHTTVPTVLKLLASSVKRESRMPDAAAVNAVLSTFLLGAGTFDQPHEVVHQALELMTAAKGHAADAVALTALSLFVERHLGSIPAESCESFVPHLEGLLKLGPRLVRSAYEYAASKTILVDPRERELLVAALEISDGEKASWVEIGGIALPSMRGLSKIANPTESNATEPLSVASMTLADNEHVAVVLSLRALLRTTRALFTAMLESHSDAASLRSILSKNFTVSRTAGYADAAGMSDALCTLADIGEAVDAHVRDNKDAARVAMLKALAANPPPAHDDVWYKIATEAFKRGSHMSGQRAAEALAAYMVLQGRSNDARENADEPLTLVSKAALSAGEARARLLSALPIDDLKAWLRSTVVKPVSSGLIEDTVKALVSDDGASASLLYDAALELIPTSVLSAPSSSMAGLLRCISVLLKDARQVEAFLATVETHLRSRATAMSTMAPDVCLTEDAFLNEIELIRHAAAYSLDKDRLVEFAKVCDLAWTAPSDLKFRPRVPFARLYTDSGKRSAAEEKDGIVLDSDGRLIEPESDSAAPAASGKAAAAPSQLCTFEATGSEFVDQHWYCCYTCGLNGSEGCCSVCVDVCHKGHDVTYMRRSRFFCDCGVRAGRCKARKGGRVASPPTVPSSTTPAIDVEAVRLQEDWEMARRAVSARLQRPLVFENIPKPAPRSSLATVAAEYMKGVVVATNALYQRTAAAVAQPEAAFKFGSLRFSPSEIVRSSPLISLPKGQSRPSRWNVDEGRTQRQLMSDGVLTKRHLAISASQLLVIREGDYAGVSLDIAKDGAVKADSPSTTNLLSFGFKVISSVVNPVEPTFMVVLGLRDVVVCTIDPASPGNFSERLTLDVSGELDSFYVIKAEWLPQSRTHLAVTTNHAVFIFDLSVDAQFPKYYLVLEDDTFIVDSTVALDKEALAASNKASGRAHLMSSSSLESMVVAHATLFVLSQNGVIHLQSLQHGANEGRFPLTMGLENICDDESEQLVMRKGHAICYANHSRLLIYSFNDGETMMARLSTDMLQIVEKFQLCPRRDSSQSSGDEAPSADLYRFHKAAPWADFSECAFDDRIVLVARSRRHAQAIALQWNRPVAPGFDLSFAPSSASTPIQFQFLPGYREGRGIDAIVLATPANSEPFFVTHNQDDSVSCARVVPAPAAASSPLLSRQEIILHRAGTDAEETIASSDISPTIFERFDNITRESSYSSTDIDQLSSIIKQRLTTPGRNVTASSANSGFKLTVTSPSEARSIVGVRVHVGEVDISTVPTELRIFNRAIPCYKNVPRWYDIPFLPHEIARGTREVVLHVGVAHNNGRSGIDAVEVYTESAQGSRPAPVVKALSMHDALEAAFTASLPSVCVTHDYSLLEAAAVAALGLAIGTDGDAMKRAAVPILEAQPAPHLVHLFKQLVGRGFANAQHIFAEEVANVSHAEALLEMALQSFVLPSARVPQPDANFAASLVSKSVALALSEPLDVQARVISKSVALLLSCATVDSLAATEALEGMLLDHPCPSVRAFTASALAIEFACGPSALLARTSAAEELVLLFEQGAKKEQEEPAKTEAVPEPSQPQPEAPTDDAAPHRGRATFDNTLSRKCDSCNLFPLVSGFHCRECDDFDVCDDCYDMDLSHLHDASHEYDYFLPPSLSESNYPDLHRLLDEAAGLDEERVGEEEEEYIDDHDFDDDEAEEAEVVSDDDDEGSDSANEAASDDDDTDEHEAGFNAFQSRMQARIASEFGRSRRMNLNGRDMPHTPVPSRARPADTVPDLPVAPKSPAVFDAIAFDNERVRERYMQLLHSKLFERLTQATVARLTGENGRTLLAGLRALALLATHASAENLADAVRVFGEALKAAVDDEGLWASSAQSLEKIVHVVSLLLLFTKRAAAYKATDSRIVVISMGDAAAKGATQAMESIQGTLQTIAECLVRIDSAAFAVQSQDVPFDTLSLPLAEEPVPREWPFLNEVYEALRMAEAAPLSVDHLELVRRVALTQVMRVALALVQAGSLGQAEVERWSGLATQVMAQPPFAKAIPSAGLLLVAASGSRDAALMSVDGLVYESFLSQLREQLAAVLARGNSYMEHASAVALLRAILRRVNARPAGWAKFIQSEEGPSALAFLLKNLPGLPEDVVVQIIHLSAVGMSGAPPVEASAKSSDRTPLARLLSMTGVERSEADSSSSGSPKPLSPPPSVSSGPDDQLEAPAAYADMLELVCTQELIRTAVGVMVGVVAKDRAAASALVKQIFVKSDWSLRSTICHVLWSLLPSLPAYGPHCSEFVQLLGQLFLFMKQAPTRFDPDNAHLGTLVEVLAKHNRAIVGHANSALYEGLEQHMSIDGYFLESGACSGCFVHEPQPAVVDLSAPRIECKYYDSATMIRFPHRLTFSSFTMNISGVLSTRTVRKVNLYFSNKRATDPNDLKNYAETWSKCGSATLSRTQVKVTIDFEIPVTATMLVVEFWSYYETGSEESLLCPRCNRLVTDRHGICRNCHENAFQCRACRNINYENLQGFLCIDCGFCKYGKFSYSVNGWPSDDVDRVETDQDEKQCLAVIEAESQKARDTAQRLQRLRRPIERVLAGTSRESVSVTEATDPPTTHSLNRKVVLLSQLYNREARSSFIALSKSVRVLASGRREILAFHLGRSTSTAAAPVKDPSRTCYGCLRKYVHALVALLGDIAQADHGHAAFLVDRDIIQELLTYNVRRGSAPIDPVVALFSALVEDNESATQVFLDAVTSSIRIGLQQASSIDLGELVGYEVALLCKLALIDDALWEMRLKHVFRLFFTALPLCNEQPVVLERLVLPCLAVIIQRSTLDKDAAATATDAPSLTPASFPAWMSQDDTYASWLARRAAQASFGGSMREAELVAKYYCRWLFTVRARRRRLSGASATPDDMSAPSSRWLGQLLLTPLSKTVREQAAKLIAGLASSSPSVAVRFLDVLRRLLPQMAGARENAAEYFALLRRFAEPHRMYLASKGFVGELCDAVAGSVAELSRLDGEGIYAEADLYQGFVLREQVTLLVSLVGEEHVRRRMRKRVSELFTPLLEGFLGLRALVTQRSKVTEECAGLVLQLIQSLLQASEADTEAYIKAAVEAADRIVARAPRPQGTLSRTSSLSSGDGSMLDIDDWMAPTIRRRARVIESARKLQILFEQVCSVVRPEAPADVIYFDLVKVATQEEFIRGSMVENPYSHLDAGPLMRDVKNRICNDLDMQGLIDDDNGMELLVDDKIIALDLPVDRVYRQVWMRGQGRDRSRMMIVYRLQGLDGEASEERVDSLPDEGANKEDPEVVFALTKVIGRSGGLQTVLGALKWTKALGASRELLVVLLRLLSYCSNVKENRGRLWEMHALGTLLDLLTFASSHGVEDSLLTVVESIVAEANMQTQMLQVQSTADSANHLKIFLDKMSAQAETSNPASVAYLTRVLPFLVYGDESIMEMLYKFFEASLQWFDYTDESSTYFLDLFVDIAEHIQRDANGDGLRTFFFRRGVVSGVCTFLKLSRPRDATSAEEWAKLVDLHVLPQALRLLGALCRGANVEELRQHVVLEHDEVLTVIHQLEQRTSERRVGSLAETVLDEMAETDDALGERVKAMRDETKADKRKRAMEQREKMLKELGFEQTNGAGGTVRIVSSAKVADADNVDLGEEEEGALLCCVCREGYRHQPTESFLIYVYGKPVTVSVTDLPMTPSERFVSHVSHFNVIHARCHASAMQADRGRQREVWEGASLRNSNTKTNSVMPVHGGSVPDDRYDLLVDAFFLRSLQILGGGAVTGSSSAANRFKLTVQDVRSQLMRFAFQEPFHTDALGGGRESNIQLIPFQLQLALHLWDKLQPAERTAAESLLTRAADADALKSAITRAMEPQDACYALVLTLLLRTEEQWNGVRIALLKTCIVEGQCASMVKEEDSSSLTTPTATTRGILLFYTLVSLFHSEVFNQTHKEGEVWPAPRRQLLKEGYRDVLARVRGVLETYEEELVHLETFQEFFDVAGVLDDVIKESGSAEDFVKAVATSAGLM